MKPQEFIDKWLGWAKNKEDINDEILADLDAMNQALRIHDVVGRSEQLPNMSLEQAIAKAKPNLDKIKDVDKYLDDIR